MRTLRQDLVLRKVGDDYIMVDPGQGMVDLSKVHTLNETAAWLWENLTGKDVTVERVAGLLCERFEVTQERATSDALALIREFEVAGLFEA
ncbi:PqqD family protein [Sphingobacterium corticibacterium]|uniref:PqqD family protein n=1 Tax=Sphingobacterium corticibacterium TaxID=2484746 RepID=A0A4Q6XQZ8_9SPHI|nr:PqqD family protein [Sphingobacterium corticibacterium]RZF58877.1 PqqD family protein [Sphingobacterium corticibacterium]